MLRQWRRRCEYKLPSISDSLGLESWGSGSSSLQRFLQWDSQKWVLESKPRKPEKWKDSWENTDWSAHWLLSGNPKDHPGLFTHLNMVSSLQNSFWNLIVAVLGGQMLKRWLGHLEEGCSSALGTTGLYTVRKWGCQPVLSLYVHLCFSIMKPFLDMTHSSQN